MNSPALWLTLVVVPPLNVGRAHHLWVVVAHFPERLLSVHILLSVVALLRVKSK